MATAQRGLFRRQQPSRPGLRVLTAAATRINLADRVETARQQRLRQGWQLQAWGYRDQIAELRYALEFLANCAARMKVFPAAYPVDGESDNPVPLHELPNVPASVIVACGQAMTDLGDGRLELSEKMRSLSTNLSVAGEGNLLGQQDAETGRVVYSIRSISEIVIKEDRYYLCETPVDSQGVLGQEALDMEETVLSRIWRPHPQYRIWADSPLRAMRDDCESLLILRRMIRAEGRSRLAGAGMLLVPEELELKLPANDNDDPEADDFLGDLTEAMMTPIAEEGVASAVVPIVVRGPGAILAEVRYLDFARTFDAQSSKTREEVLGIIATGLDLPKEIIQGVADLNHWSAWQVDDNTFRHHVEPHVITCCDGLTGAFLRPYLKAQNVPDEWVQRILFWYDPTELVTHPDQTKDALDLHDRLVISDEAMLRVSGFADTDRPTKAEVQVRLLEKMRMWPPNLVMAFLHAWDPTLVAPPITVAGTVPGIKPTGVDTGEPGPGQLPAGTPVPVQAAPAPKATPSPAAPGPPAADRPSPQPPAVTGSGGEPNTGVMVALYPPPELAATWALSDGEPADELHITLAFLGAADQLEDPDALRTAVAGWAKQTPPIDGEISGVGLFTAGEDPVTYLSIDLPSLPEARQQLVNALGTAGCEPSQTHGFTPHLTLDYADRVGEVDAATGGAKVSFGSVAVVIAEDRTDYPFSAALTASGRRASGERLSRKLAEIDRDLRARLQTAANAAMLRQLERVGNRLRSKVAKDETLRTQIAHRRNDRVAAILGPDVVAAAGINVDQMLGDDWQGLQAQFLQWTEAAQKQALRIALKLGGIAATDAAAVTAEQAMASGRETAWGVLSGALTGLSEHLLYNPDPNTDQGDWGALNPSTLVPAGTIRAALAVAGGAATTTISTGAAGATALLSPVGQIGTGATVGDLISQGGGQQAGYEWNHASTVIDPFEPHQDLDGVEFENFDDEQLANPGDWPPVEYLMPGDHSGCTCDFVPIWLSASTE